MPVRESSGFTATLPVPDYTPLPRKSGARAATPGRPRVLSVSADSEDHRVLQRILEGLPFQISTVTSCQEALEYLGHDRTCVIFCDHKMKDGTWRDLLNRVSAADEPPLMVVTSRLADDYLWAEVLNLGGFDVLAKPFREREVLHVLDSARIHRANPAPRRRVAGAA